MVGSVSCPTHGRHILYLFLAALAFAGAFSSGLQITRNNFGEGGVSNLKKFMLEPPRLRASSPLNVKKRKDNRKYVISSKDDEDEPDDDYFKDLAEDVKELLRSSRKDSKPMESPATSSTTNLVVNELSTANSASNGGILNADTVLRNIESGDNNV